MAAWNVTSQVHWALLLICHKLWEHWGGRGKQEELTSEEDCDINTFSTEIASMA